MNKWNRGFHPKFIWSTHKLFSLCDYHFFVSYSKTKNTEKKTDVFKWIEEEGNEEKNSNQTPIIFDLLDK